MTEDLATRLAQTQDERDRIRQDLGKLRKQFAQQLTQTSDLINVIRRLDSDYFGDRFWSQEGEGDLFGDLRLAREVVAALGEELTGIGAFADSPVLRDGVHNLVTAMESLRQRAIELERGSLEAVGLSPDVSRFEQIGRAHV